MNRNEKQSVIEAMKQEFQESQASFLVAVKGLTVGEVQKFRKGLYEKGGSLKVAKNTLLKRATADLPGLDELSPYFKEQIAIVFAKNETPAVAKFIAESSKENERLKIIIGALNKKVITKAQIESLAALPPREVLLAQVCGTLNAPIVGFVSLLNQLVVRLLWVLKKIEEKKSNQA
jgi:large subunit ribosomal protein L10